MASSIKLDMFTFTYLLSFSLLFVAALWVGDNGRSRAGVAKRGFARLPARARKSRIEFPAASPGRDLVVTAHASGNLTSPLWKRMPGRSTRRSRRFG